MIGELLIYNISSKPKEKVHGLLRPTLHMVWEDRLHNNAKCFNAFTENTHSHFIWQSTQEDVVFVAMGLPRRINYFSDIRDCIGSRRFMVEQVKEPNCQKVVAHRQIDHLVKSQVNPATRSFETLQNDNIDFFFNIIRWCLSC